jgi:uncharacterized RDD family membrane protein YckC
VITGAVAAKLAPIPQPEATEPTTLKTRRVAPSISRPVQTELFGASPDMKVVSIARYAPAPEPKSRPRTESTTRSGGTKTSTKRVKPAPEGQGTLEFLPALPPKARELGSSVEAVIFCEFPVATTLHRAIASALDWSMVLIGYGIFLGGIHQLGCQLTLTKSTFPILGGMFFVMAFMYGLCFAIAGADTPGMIWTRLRLTTFDGLPPDLKQRLGRFAAAGLSRCTMLGLLWSLVDEESLTWHDHMSRTFPTPRDAEGVVFKHR